MGLCPRLVGRQNTEYFMENIPAVLHRQYIDGENGLNVLTVVSLSEE